LGGWSAPRLDQEVNLRQIKRLSVILTNGCAVSSPPERLLPDFTGAGHLQVLFYVGGDHNWWLGAHQYPLTRRQAENTAGFGNLLDGQHQFWTGDFTGVGHSQVLFYHGGESNWWVGTVAK
jgi:hypothetical protein